MFFYGIVLWFMAHKILLHFSFLTKLPFTMTKSFHSETSNFWLRYSFLIITVISYSVCLLFLFHIRNEHLYASSCSFFLYLRENWGMNFCCHLILIVIMLSVIPLLSTIKNHMRAKLFLIFGRNFCISLLVLKKFYVVRRNITLQQLKSCVCCLFLSELSS